MNIRYESYPLLARHAELVSASFVAYNQLFAKRTLKQVQGDALVLRFPDIPKKQLGS